ncbi:MAG: transposase [Candidatus Kapaibacterium sp.]
MVNLPRTVRYTKHLQQNTHRTSRSIHYRHSRIRARAEHCFGVMMNLIGLRKLSYRGLERNRNRVVMTCTLMKSAWLPWCMRRTIVHIIDGNGLNRSAELTCGSNIRV